MFPKIKLGHPDLQIDLVKLLRCHLGFNDTTIVRLGHSNLFDLNF